MEFNTEQIEKSLKLIRDDLLNSSNDLLLISNQLESTEVIFLRCEKIKAISNVVEMQSTLLHDSIYEIEYINRIKVNNAESDRVDKENQVNRVGNGA